jgi:hypothetical protein
VSRQEVEEKFTGNVRGLVGASAAERLKSLAGKLDALANANEIVEIMASRIEPKP